MFKRLGRSFKYIIIFCEVMVLKSRIHYKVSEYIVEDFLHIHLYRYDYLMIKNEKDETFGVYCGFETGKQVVVTGDYVVLEFHADGSIQVKGFLLIFTAVSGGKYHKHIV